ARGVSHNLGQFWLSDWWNWPDVYDKRCMSGTVRTIRLSWKMMRPATLGPGLAGRSSGGCHSTRPVLHEGPRMAKTCALWVAAVAVFALAGCQAEQPPSLVKKLPPPNLNGPSDLSAP